MNLVKKQNLPGGAHLLSQRFNLKPQTLNSCVSASTSPATGESFKEKSFFWSFLLSVYFAQYIFSSPKTKRGRKKKKKDKMSSTESHHLNEEPEVFSRPALFYGRGIGFK
jgi:hypothetical protein